MKITALTTLDALFDTRLACLKYINKDWAIGVLNNGYFDRLSDKFSLCNPKIIDDVYYHYWDNRNIHMLRNSIQTNVINHLKKDTFFFSVAGDGHPESVELTLYINIWPYEMGSVEIKNVCDAIKDATGAVKIMVLNTPMKDITVEYIANNFKLVILYDFFNEWFEYNKQEVLNCHLRNVSFKAPVLIRRDCDEATYDEKEYAKVNTCFRGMFELELLAASEFSLALPNDVKLK